MLDLFIVISRYVFIVLIVFFLMQGVLYILYDKGYKHGDIKRPILAQRAAIICMHLIAFSILLLEKLNSQYFSGILVFSVVSLLFIVIALFLTSRICKNSMGLLYNGVFLLADLSFIMLYSLSNDKYTSLPERQLFFLATGFFAMLFVMLFIKKLPKLEKFRYLYFIVGLLLLGSTFILGTEEFGATNWITYGSFSFQPSEFVKVLFILFVASSLHKNKSLQNVLLTCALSASFVVILVMQTDLGGALIFFVAFMMVLYTATGSELLFILGFSGASAAAYFAFIYFPHIQKRVAAWQNPWKSLDDTGYQITQSLFAIATWPVAGSGLTRGMSESIPVVTRDFMFSAICDEFGVIFALGIIGVYIMMLYCGVSISMRSQNIFHNLLSLGIISMIAVQTFIIIAGDIKMIPMTGVTLSFLSYGGSSVFISIIMVGILHWINNSNQKFSEDEQNMEGQNEYK